MRRGDLVTVAARGDYGKPRPAVVVQADALNSAQSASVIVALVTIHLREAPLLRLAIEPSAASGLQRPCQVMVDRLLTVPIPRLGAVIGRLSDQELVALNRRLAFVIGLA